MHPITALAVLPLLVGALCAQTTVYPLVSPRANYTVVTGSGTGAPTSRMWGGSATDGTRLFVFGGRTSPSGTAGTVYFNGLYAYDAVGNAWTTLSAENDPNAPATGFRQAMAYDPLGNRIVVFGGIASALAGATIYGTCHAFDLGTNTWSQIPNPTPGTTGPVPVDGAHMAFDATSGSLVLFGGVENATGPVRSGATWLLSGSTWTQVPGLTPGVTAPTARNIHGMTARSAPYNDVVLVGGNDGTNRTDTWRWDGSTQTWTELVPINSTAPVSWVSGNEIVYDALRQVVVINNGPGTNVAPSNTTSGSTGWVSEYDCVTNEWRAFGVSLTSQTTTTTVLGNLQRAFSAFVNGSVLIWGGQNSGTVGDADITKVKTYQASPLAGAGTYGLGCNGLSLAADAAPWSGRNWTLTCNGFSATAIGALAISLAPSSLPLPTPPGVGGCDLLVDSSLVYVTTLLLPVAGSASYTDFLPLFAGFGGLPMNAQAFAFDNGQLTSSNGVAGVLGAN